MRSITNSSPAGSRVTRCGATTVPLPPELRERLLRECQRLALAEQQLATLEKTRRANVPTLARRRSNALARLKGMGDVGTSRLALELQPSSGGRLRRVGAAAL